MLACNAVEMPTTYVVAGAKGRLGLNEKNREAAGGPNVPETSGEIEKAAAIVPGARLD